MEGESILEQQPAAVAERLDRRDLFLRLASVIGMVGVAFALLMMVHTG
jgi:hypothetical protein